MNFHITHTKSHSYILAIALLSLIFLFTLNTSHALSFPAGITNYVALNISNSQSTATPNPFQQMINITSADSGWTYINNTGNHFGQNVEFFYANGTIIPSWLENYTSGHAIWWVKVGSIAASSKLTIYMGFASKTTNLFNNKTTGEAPQLSSTYAEYDNGANVFSNYFNFAGTTLDSRVSPITGVTLTQNNGLSISVSTIDTAFYILTSVSQTSPFVLESDETYYGVGTGTNINEEYGLVIDSSTSTSQNTGGGPGGTNFMVRISNGDTNPQVFYDATSEVSGTRSYASQYTAIDSFTQSPSEVTGTFDGTSTSYSTTALTSGYIGFYLYTAVANSNIATIQWLRTRTYPPNGVMPFVTAGTPSNFPYYNTTTYEDLL